MFTMKMFTVVLSVLGCMLILISPAHLMAAEEVIPNEIKNLSMGSSKAALMERISGVGTVTSDTPDKKRRPSLKWTIPDNPHYEDVVFNFTEKDRLFLIRFNFKQVDRKSFQNLKKAFFDYYNFSWEDPMRLRIKNSDVLLYAPEKGNTFFLEFTDKNGAKAVELFDKSISAQDRFGHLSSSEKKTNTEGKESQTLPEDKMAPTEMPEKN